MAFESKKLNETGWRLLTHEKEMWAVIHYFKTWGHYIGSKDVVVWIDNVTLKYFATQPKLSSKQVRWQDTLALFNVDIWHKFGQENVVLDALSRKHQLKVVYMGETKFQKEVRLASCCNEWRAPKSRGETHLRVPQSQVAESWDLEARSRLPTLERGKGSSWEPMD
jgi:hypothetical protein